MPNQQNNVIVQQLCDVYDDTSTVAATVKTSLQGIRIYIHTYDKISDANEVILIELANGVPQLVIWADKNQEEPTHIINLDGVL